MNSYNFFYIWIYFINRSEMNSKKNLNIYQFTTQYITVFQIKLFWPLKEYFLKHWIQT